MTVIILLCLSLLRRGQSMMVSFFVRNKKGGKSKEMDIKYSRKNLINSFKGCFMDIWTMIMIIYGRIIDCLLQTCKTLM